MSSKDEIIAEALIGDEAKKFLESDLGRCLVGMANQEAAAALEALASVNPTDVPAIERLQNRAKLGRMFEDFLKELISAGETALAQWSQNNESER